MSLPDKIRSCPAWPFLAAASLTILASAPAQYLGRQQDDLIYFIAARALTLGHYYLLTSPNRIPLTMASPGLPVLLAPLILIFGENPGVCQVFSALLLAIIPWILWLWLRRRRGDWIALIIALLFGLSPVVLSQAGTLMSEAPFLLLTLLVLMALENSSSRLAGVLLMAAVQIRSAGLAFLPGALAEVVRAKNWKKSFLIAAPALAGFGLWSFWSLRAAGAMQKAQELAFSYNGKFWSLWPRVAWINARYYLDAWGSSYLPQRFSYPEGTILGVILCGLALAGAWRILRRKPTDAAVWMLMGFVALHLVWPWRYDRYLIVPLPFLLDCAAASLKRGWAIVLMACLLTGQMAFQSPRWVEGTSWSTIELAQTYQWLNAHSRPQDIVASALYVRDGFYAQRPSLPLPGKASAPELSQDMKKYRIRFILWQDGLDVGLSLNHSAVVAQILAKTRHDLEDAALFQMIYANPQEHSRIYILRGQR